MNLDRFRLTNRVGSNPSCFEAIGLKRFLGAWLPIFVSCGWRALWLVLPLSWTLAADDGAFCADQSFRPFGDRSAIVYDMQVQTDGKVLLIGRFPDRESFLVRIDARGEVDETFNAPGDEDWSWTRIGTQLRTRRVTGVAQLHNGDLLVAPARSFYRLFHNGIERGEFSAFRRETLNGPFLVDGKGRVLFSDSDRNLLRMFPNGGGAGSALKRLVFELI